jgi:hypothetical protein
VILPPRRALLGVLVYVVVVALLAVVLSQAVTTNRTSQRDHDCIVELALMLADPARDRTKPPEVPVQCRHRE